MTPLKLLAAASLSLSMLFTGYGQSSPNAGASKMAANKETVKKLYLEFNKHNLKMFDLYFASDVIDHGAFEGQAPGRKGLKDVVKGMFDAYPDINVQQLELLADGDFVITRDLWNATEKGTGKKKTGETIHIFKFRDGLVQDEWSKGWEWME